MYSLESFLDVVIMALQYVADDLGDIIQKSGAIKEGEDGEKVEGEEGEKKRGRGRRT